jgi:glycosyltransferase involved in cell wall biosynthesis
MSAGKAILLLGRRDEPTDGVLDYCQMLREAAARRGLLFELVQVAWADKSWGAALAELRKQAEAWRGQWVLLQFTTLAWSRRGFPLRAPRVLSLLRQCGVRTGVVFHDFFPLPGKGVASKLRQYSQARALRQLYSLSDLSVFTVPVNKVSWLPLHRDKATFVPVGSNFPEPNSRSASSHSTASEKPPTIAVFGITGGDRGDAEVSDIEYAVKSAHSNGLPLRLAAIGRGCEVFEAKLRRAFAGTGIEVAVPGLMPAADLACALAGATVLLCVRGQVSSRRGSAIAGIACGLPIVGYCGEETGFPITEAGVMLLNQGDREGLAQALRTVLSDEKLHEELKQRSEAAALKYFSWDAITLQFVAALSGR